MEGLEDDFITTISDDDAEIPYEDEGETLTKPSLKRKREDAPTGKKKKHQKRDAEEDELRTEDDGAMDPEFEFDAGDFRTAVTEDFDGWGLGEAESQKTGDKKGVDIDELVERRKAKKVPGGKRRQMDEDDEEEESDEEDDVELDLENDELLADDAFGMGAANEDDEEEEEGSDDGSDSDSVASPVPHPDDESPPTDDESPPTDEESDAEERAKAEAFFAPEPTKSKPIDTTTFQNMSLSRPILRGLAGLNFSTPTPIQAKTIPVALMGKDVVGGAVTGSGKTAAFMIPILERLIYRPKKIPTTRVVVLVPTRELAVQCTNVAQKLAAFTDIGFAQLVGGFSVREQENVLRRRPDVVIATPGRFIDHMRNTAAFAVDGIEILVLDEADRMLEEGFADELNEILTTLPRSRQTMLFSATMTSKVDDLIRVGLQRPSRLLVDAQRQTAGTLIQEFVRLRPGREGMRLAYLLHLASDVYTARTIIFFRQKKEAHRVRVVFALFGIRAAELHGSMTQEQRMASVEAFRAGTATHLLATDVASRGLDIRGVEAVLNYEAPQTHEIYLHRVGRTARMGKAGRACTLAAEPDRKVVKAAVKTGRAQGAKIVSRAIPADAAAAWTAKLEGIEDDIREVLADEKEEKALAQADMQVRKGENMIAHEAEIKSRPKRTWFASESEKKRAQEAARMALNGDIKSGSQRERRDQALVKGGKLSNKDRKRLDDRRERKEGRLYKKGKGDAAKVAGKSAKAAKDKAKGKGGKDAAAGKSRENKRYGLKMKAGKKR